MSNPGATIPESHAGHRGVFGKTLTLDLAPSGDGDGDMEIPLGTMHDLDLVWQSSIHLPGLLFISTYKPQDGGEESDSSLRIKASCCFLVVFVRRRRVRHRVIHFKIDVVVTAK